jgi:hypothetical protein
MRLDFFIIACYLIIFFFGSALFEPQVSAVDEVVLWGRESNPFLFFCFRTVMTQRKKRQGLLSPLRVLDLTDGLGLLGGKILGNLGAGVIKIEQTCRVLPRNHGPFDGIPE